MDNHCNLFPECAPDCTQEHELADGGKTLPCEVCGEGAAGPVCRNCEREGREEALARLTYHIGVPKPSIEELVDRLTFARGMVGSSLRDDINDTYDEEYTAARSALIERCGEMSYCECGHLIADHTSEGCMDCRANQDCCLQSDSGEREPIVKLLDELEKAVVVCAREICSSNLGWYENPRWNAARAALVERYRELEAEKVRWIDRIMQDTRDLEYHAAENDRLRSRIASLEAENAELREDLANVRTMNRENTSRFRAENERLRATALTEDEARAVTDYASGLRHPYINNPTSLTTGLAKLRSSPTGTPDV